MTTWHGLNLLCIRTFVNTPLQWYVCVVCKHKVWSMKPSENPEASEGQDRLRYVKIGLCRWHLPWSAQINTKYSRNIVNWNLIKIIHHFYNFMTSISESTFSIILLSCFSTSLTVDLAHWSLACEDGHITHHETHTLWFQLPLPLSLPPLCLHHEWLTPHFSAAACASNMVWFKLMQVRESPMPTLHSWFFISAVNQIWPY